MARRFSFILPADWWRIPLISEDARRANVDHLVDRQFPQTDEAAQLRHELKVELHRQAVQAADIGGMVMAFYLRNIEGVPVSATMTCYDFSGLLSLPEELNPVKFLAHYVGDKELDESLPNWSETLPKEPNEAPTEPATAPTEPDQAGEPQTVSDQQWEKVTDYDVLAYRHETTNPGTDYFGEDVPKVEQLQVTYLQMVSDFGLVQTVFSTPLTQAHDIWLQMWDAMVAAFRNGAPEPGTTEQREETGDESA
ncbi:MAG: hypothetical protein LBI33_09020 [Propionibacteriaceae bacterium]|jgi:hypothetical protein|nr:hypothetical protein [Propionibacteriaceae bacterium]